MKDFNSTLEDLKDVLFEKESENKKIASTRVENLVLGAKEEVNTTVEVEMMWKQDNDFCKGAATTILSTSKKLSTKLLSQQDVQHISIIRSASNVSANDNLALLNDLCLKKKQLKLHIWT